MSYFQQLVSVLREQFHATLSRSDVLKPLAWLAGILLTAMVGMLWVKAPSWLTVLMAILLSVSIVLYLISYVYCLLRDPDALRSETYSLHKMVIERGLLGDNVTGVIDLDVEQPRAISQATWN